jgi:quinol monooxygenase YgiN
MAIGLLFDGVGVSQAQYEQVFNEVFANGTRRAPGLLTHHAGPTEDGFCVIETWESPEALERFFQDKLGRALAAANVRVQPKIFPISNTF